MGQGPQKPDHGGNFVMMPRRVIASPAWRELPHRARSVLMVIFCKHNGFNNGRIAIKISDIGQALGDQNHGANGKAVARLIELGFLECTSEADRHRSKTREYRITFISTGEGKNVTPATHEYKDWKPTGKRKFGPAKTAAESRFGTAGIAAERKVTDAKAAIQLTESRQSSGGCRTAVPALLLNNHSQGWEHKPAPQLVAPSSQQDESLRMSLEELRRWANAVVLHLGYGGQKQLSELSRVPAPIISKFRHGRSLPSRYRGALQVSCGRLLPHKQWREAA